MKQTTAAIGAWVLLGLATSAWTQDEGTAFDSEGGFESGQSSGQDQGASDQRQQQPNAQSGPGSDSGARGAARQQQRRGQLQNVETQQFEDWRVQCGTVPNSGQERCQMSQEVTRSDSDEAVMRMAVGFTPRNDQPAAIFQLPLGIVLPKGIGLRVDKGEPVRFPVQICVQQGCRADLPLKDALLSQLKGGRTAYVIARTPRAESGTVELPISLMGFTAAFNRISKAR
jgi:invasion protein IalB